MLSWIVCNFVFAVIFEINLYAYKIPVYHCIITVQILLKETLHLHVICNHFKFNMLLDDRLC